MDDRTAIFVPEYPGIVFMGKAWVVPPHLPQDVKRFPSILLVHGLPMDYTVDELDKLDAFGQALTKDYDDNFGADNRNKAHMAEMGKSAGGQWISQKVFWTQGRVNSPTLDEGIAFLGKSMGLELDAVDESPRMG